MWKDYSISYTKKNKATSISIMVAAFVSALFISLLCSLLYNMFVDNEKRFLDNTSALQAQKPSMLRAFYVFLVILVCISLILIIRSAFQFSMNARIHQLGILQSIGATPKQVQMVLLQEAILLSIFPILLGVVAGIVLCIGFLRYANTITSQLNLSKAIFEYHYLLFLLTLGCSFLTILLSAWLPAIKLSKISPLQAIRGEYDIPVKRIRRFRLTKAFLGIEGDLARKALYIRRKSFRTSTLCLTISYLVFTIFLDFMTLSEISTTHSYFERYKDAWDVMLEIKNPDRNTTDLLHQLRTMDAIDRVTAYQKATVYTTISRDSISDEVNALGGYPALNSSFVQQDSGTYLVEMPTVILDDTSYENYSSTVFDKEEVKQPSAVLVNTIWDSKNSTFRSKKYIPFLKSEALHTVTLYSDAQALNEVGAISTVAYLEAAPVLREEYKNYTLVQILSQSTYGQLSQKLTDPEDKLYINICAVSDESIESIENHCKAIIGTQYEYIIESRPDKEASNTKIYDGYRQLLSAICGLLACIGIANVFANTLGYIYQRKREFARYQSIGLTPGGMNKFFLAAAIIVGAKPILMSIPFQIIFVVFAINASGINRKEFIDQMPITPKLCFGFVLLASVGLCYFLGSRRMKCLNIAESLKDDTLY